MEFDPYLANWIETSPKPSPTLPVAIQLHEETYMRLNLEKPTAHPSCRPQVNQHTSPTEVTIQAVAGTGAQMDVISLTTLKSLEFDPNTLLKVQIKITSAIKESQMDIKRWNIPVSLLPRHSRNLKKVRLFYMACNVCQNYLSCPCLRALFVIGQYFPRTGAATSNTP